MNEVTGHIGSDTASDALPPQPHRRCEARRVDQLDRLPAMRVGHDPARGAPHHRRWPGLNRHPQPDPQSGRRQSREPRQADDVAALAVVQPPDMQAAGSRIGHRRGPRNRECAPRFLRVSIFTPPTRRRRIHAHPTPAAEAGERGSSPLFTLLGCVRRCPTLPHPLGCSTIGAARLSFRVRNGTGRFPCAMTTETFFGCLSLPCGWGGLQRVCWFRYRIVDASVCRLCVTCFVGCVTSPRPISTSQLHTLLCFHVWPINPMVCRGPYPLDGGESPHLEACFPLRCFQRLSFPNVANQPCPWQDNWHTRGWSVPVLSY